MNIAKGISLTILALVMVLLFSQCGKGVKRVSTKDLIIELNSSMKDDLSLFLKEKLKDVVGLNVVIKFDTGEYHFFPEQAMSEYLTISNNDNGEKRIAIPVFGAKSFRIEGNGANLVFH